MSTASANRPEATVKAAGVDANRPITERQDASRQDSGRQVPDRQDPVPASPEGDPQGAVPEGDVPNPVQGEGDYKSARVYRKDIEGFIDGHKDNISAMAKTAENALDGPEGAELKKAEDKGKAKARH